MQQLQQNREQRLNESVREGDVGTRLFVRRCSKVGGHLRAGT
jgi:hypothetical protein